MSVAIKKIISLLKTASEEISNASQEVTSGGTVINMTKLAEAANGIRRDYHENKEVIREVK